MSAQQESHGQYSFVFNPSSEAKGFGKIPPAQRFVFFMTIFIALFALVFGLSAIQVIRSSLIAAVDNDLRDAATLVQNNTQSYLGSGTTIELDLPPLDVFRASGLFIQVWENATDGTPQLSQSSNNLMNFKQSLDPNALKDDTATYSNVVINDIELRVMTSPLRVSGQDKVLGYIQMGTPLQSENDIINKVGLLLLMGGVILVGGMFVVGQIGVRRLVGKDLAFKGQSHSHA